MLSLMHHITVDTLHSSTYFLSREAFLIRTALTRILRALQNQNGWKTRKAVV